MDAPKGRYSVLEKDGRLIVVDNRSGDPVTRSPAPPGAGAPPPVVAPVGSALDGAAALAVRLVARERDEQGRAVIDWEWQENGKTKRWDARLDAPGQRRLGRALLSLAAAPLLLLLAVLLFGLAAIWLSFLLIAPLAGHGFWSLRRLQAETGGTG